MPPLFASSERQYDIFFRYPWREVDLVNIALPSGFTLEKAEAPRNLGFDKAGAYNVSLAVRNGKDLVLTRQFDFGNEGYLFFSHTAFAQLKAAFDELHRRDDTTLALKQTPPEAAK